MNSSQLNFDQSCLNILVFLFGTFEKYEVQLEIVVNDLKWLLLNFLILYRGVTRNFLGKGSFARISARR